MIFLIPNRRVRMSFLDYYWDFTFYDFSCIQGFGGFVFLFCFRVLFYKWVFCSQGRHLLVPFHAGFLRVIFGQVRLALVHSCSRTNTACFILYMHRWLKLTFSISLRSIYLIFWRL